MIAAAGTGLKPNAEAIREHLEHMFGGYLDGHQNGSVEIAWSNDQGAVLYCRYFGTDELAEATEKAVEVNSKGGVNVYVGAALRRPGMPQRRSNDKDVLAATCYYADLDDPGAAERAKDIYGTAGVGVMPTCSVVTGRHPHTRVQFWWRLSNPDVDQENTRAVGVAIANKLSGDLTVVNPSRVMRLGGSVAWPHKPGRVAELTEVVVYQDDRPKSYVAEHVARTFQVGPPTSSTALALTSPPAVAVGPDPENFIGIDGVNAKALQAKILTGQEWHNEIIRLVGSYINRGLSDAEIIQLTADLTLPGYTVADTRKEVQKAVDGGRRKWNIPEPTTPQDDPIEEPTARTPPINPQSWAGRAVPEREWLVDQWIPRRYTTALYGDGGLGKTLMAQQLLTSVSLGIPWLGLPVRKMRTFGLLCEDYEDDLHINQANINATYGIDYGALDDMRLWSSVGFDNLLMTFTGQESAAGHFTPFFAELLETVQAFGAQLVVIDTAADVYGGNEINRAQVRQFVGRALGQIGRAINGAVLLCAHPSLSGMSSGSGTSGSTAWNNTVRSRLYLSEPDKADPSDDTEQTDPDLRLITRKKANYARRGESILVKWVQGSFVPVSHQSGVDGVDRITLQTAILNEIERMWADGNPYSESPQASLRYVFKRLAPRIQRKNFEVKQAFFDLVDQGCVKTEMRDTHRNMQGLKVIKRPQITPDYHD